MKLIYQRNDEQNQGSNNSKRKLFNFCLLYIFQNGSYIPFSGSSRKEAWTGIFSSYTHFIPSLSKWPSEKSLLEAYNGSTLAGSYLTLYLPLITFHWQKTDDSNCLDTEALTSCDIWPPVTFHYGMEIPSSPNYRCFELVPWCCGKHWYRSNFKAFGVGG